MQINDIKKEETEKCILCGCDTEILRTVPIDQRAYYVEGCGQLCTTCGRRLNREGQCIE